jgi:hypothetical protein
MSPNGAGNTASPDRPVLRVGFVPGVEPDRFLQRWCARRPPARLELVPVAASDQGSALAEGTVDMCFVRLPIEQADELHLVPLWEERAAIVVGEDHVLTVLDEVTESDLAEETEIPASSPDDAAERVAVVATGVGFTRLPFSLARLHHRKDVRTRPLVDTASTRIALAWPRVADDPVRQEFVAVVRGRTARSSR